MADGGGGGGDGEGLHVEAEAGPAFRCSRAGCGRLAVPPCVLSCGCLVGDGMIEELLVDPFKSLRFGRRSGSNGLKRGVWAAGVGDRKRLMDGAVWVATSGGLLGQ